MSTRSIASPVPAGRPWWDAVVVRVIVWMTVLTAPAAYQAIHHSALADNNIWWHLRTGLWIMQNHAAPRTGLFSQWASLTWVDAGWGFDLLTGVAYRMFGLAGLPILLMVAQVAVAGALFLLARVACRSFWPAVTLAAVGQCCLLPLEPRPALCSVVLLSLELALLLCSRARGNPRTLFWLPLLFLVWANLDRQFEYGLLILALFCVASVVAQLWPSLADKAMPAVGTVAAVSALSVLATLVTPYGWNVFALLWQTANSVADRFFRELHSMRFRQPQDYLLMLLTMCAFFALGRRRSRDLFLASLLIIGAAISFRFSRDSWLVVVISVAILGSAVSESGRAENAGRASRREAIAVGCLVLVLMSVLGFRLIGNRGLEPTVSEKFPVRAANYIRANSLPQPLFNTYNWGGFLTWYLPEYPVSIDGRAELYGDQINVAYFKLLQAEIPMDSNPSFARAETILLEANSPVTQALSTLPGFRVAYRDDQAVVLVRNR